MRRYSIFLILILLLIVGHVSAYANYSYIAPGGPIFWNSTNNTYIQVQICGAGGSGKASWYSGGITWWGYGGSKGSCSNHTMVAVTPYTEYPIYVGAGGAQSAIDGISNNGGSSTAFGYIELGGLGGITGSSAQQNGGAGESSGVMDWSGGWGLSSAAAGQSNINFTGGAAGSGYASGGGGGPNNGTVAGEGYGGAGGQGIVNIYNMNASGFNYPDFIATPTTSGVGTVITFTDTSVINDVVNITYLWNFGDGTTSPVKGTTTHVYSNYGTFSVNLTITSDVGTTFEYKEGYMTITNVPITAWYSQKLIRLKTVDAFGNDLPGSNITINYISNSLPNKDVTWLTSAFGISQTVANQMVNGSVAMQGYTGTDSSVSFMMFPAIQYGITVTNITWGLSKYVTIYPQDNEYIIYCPLPNQTKSTAASEHPYNATLYVTEPNATHITWNLFYQDISGYTTGFYWNVTCLNNNTVMYESSWLGPGFDYTVPFTDSYTFPSEPKGVEYRAIYRATRDIP